MPRDELFPVHWGIPFLSVLQQKFDADHKHRYSDHKSANGDHKSHYADHKRRNADHK